MWNLGTYDQVCMEDLGRHAEGATHQQWNTIKCAVWVEKIISVQPLIALSDHPDNPQPLTPNKLLPLESNSCLPVNVFTEQDKCSKCRHQAHCLANAFWKRWLRDYLPTLQRRQKWYFPHHNLSIGEFDPNCCWWAGAMRASANGSYRGGLPRQQWACP